MLIFLVKCTVPTITEKFSCKYTRVVQERVTVCILLVRDNRFALMYLHF